MRIKDGESLESWAIRVQQYEYGHALMRIAEGDNVDTVMENMSRRIVEKLKYPIIKQLHQESNFEQVVNDSREKYKQYMANVGPAADHVQE